MVKNNMYIYSLFKNGLSFVAIVLLFSCNTKVTEPALFELKNNLELGIDFSNDLQYSKEFNVYKYRNFYNGGGVALGDINRDGLLDIYLVANQNKNKLYLNKGDWTFEDISSESGATGQKAWSTGVTMVDINEDGWLDIYVCNSGDVKGDNKENELFINNQDGTFKESAADYNLNDKGYSTHASFFDYDKDGDLDVYILNNSFQAIGSFNLRKNERPQRDELGGDKLMRNDNGQFMDVSNEAGIYGSVIGFGLGITVGDVNSDGWDDIYISNDFFERDYLYINNQDGTFKEDLVDQMPSISAASMGADIGDINNDGLNDIFVTEMLPSDYERLKSVTTFEDWNRYQYGVQNGYHHQFTRNTLQYNRGDGRFSEVSRLAGVEASDWSWGALFFDMNNDGLKDLFIANGIYKDLTNQDYLQYIANEKVLASVVQDDGVNYKHLIDTIPSNPVPNHAFYNQGNLRFRKAHESGLMTKGFSNGSAYGDIDNDGDLDLVVNNVNMPVFIYENKASALTENHYLNITLHPSKEGKSTIGAKVFIQIAKDSVMYFESQPARGFQSSMDPRIHIGLGKASEVDIEVIWPSGKTSLYQQVLPNQFIVIREEDGIESSRITPVQQKQIDLDTLGELFIHTENNFIDFNRELLSYHMLSNRGPCVSQGDLNNDGLLDLLIPGAMGVESKIMYGTIDGTFVEHVPEAFLSYSSSEQVVCGIYDANGDGLDDILLTNGSVELSPFSEYLFDRLFINDGRGDFIPTEGIPKNENLRMSTGAMDYCDLDGDGDLDLFLGERVKIGSYGAPGSGFILINDGHGQYKDHTEQWCASLTNIGMITDAKFVDFNDDNLKDLVIVGEFLSVRLYENTGSSFSPIAPLENTKGWWNTIAISDLDNDGRQDIILGNHGLNSRFKANDRNQVKLYYYDFDQNGFPEGIITHKRDDGKDYPYALRQNLTTRLPGLKKKYPDFKSYKNAALEDIFPKEILQQATILEANELESIILLNKGEFAFEKKKLPLSVQFSPIFAILPLDYNKDGAMDLLMGGNLYKVQPEMGRYDASFGHLLINDGTGTFSEQSINEGLIIDGEIRDFVQYGNQVMIFRNNAPALTFQY